MYRRLFIAIIVGFSVLMTACSGGVVTPSATPQPTATIVQPSATSTAIPTVTLTHTPPPSATTKPSATASKTPKPTSTHTATPTMTLSATPSATMTATATISPTAKPSKTPESTATMAATSTMTLSATPSATVTVTATISPTVKPSRTPKPTATTAPPSATVTVTATITVTPTLKPSATAVIVPSPAATTTAGASIPWLKVYFTNPNPPDVAGQGVDNYVVPVLDAAKKTIDVASFDFTLPSVTTALINAAKRGVVVRMVLDEVNGAHVMKASDSLDKQDFDALKALQDAGIPVINGGRSNGLMHNKMIIVDGTTLFMGSWNMSYNDTFRNNNNVLQITSQRLIANYQAKFNELFVNQKFGTKAVVGAQNPQLTLDGVVVENYFSPVDHVSDKLVSYVNGAKKSVKYMIFTYTDKNLAAAMIAAAKRGVDVQGVIENRGASQGAMVPLFCAQLPVNLDGNKYTMHHKVIIIDDEIVITGSYNFTATADTANDDNILVIHSAAIAALYEQEYAKVYGLGKPPDATKITCTP